MPAPRRKAPKLEAPQTIEEATALLAYYAGSLTAAEEIRAGADRSIAAIEAERDALLTPLEERLKDVFRQLRAWWSVAGPAITEGKRKSAEIAGCSIGERTAPPKLDLGNKKAEVVIEQLLEAGLESYVRTKRELDRQALIKGLAGSDAEDLIIIGLRRKQAEEFFIDRAARVPADPETVPVEEAA